MTTWPGPAPRDCEQALIDIVPRLSGSKVITNTAGRGQLAFVLATANPSADVHCLFLDLFAWEQSLTFVREIRNLILECAADFPDRIWDLAALAFSMHGEAEVTRDLIHSAYRKLSLGGQIACSTDNCNDRWLQAEIKALFPKVKRISVASGTVYVGKKSEPIRKTKHFHCQFSFRHGDRVFQLVTCPGVFSHRQLDGGARRLLEDLQVDAGQSVLEIGCGSGAASLVAASLHADVRVVAIDSSPRAVECLNESAKLNGLSNVRATLDADGRTIDSESFDLVLANPPYYSRQRIADLFVTIAARALRIGGSLLLVTKDSRWYEEHLGRWFRETSVQERKGYFVIRAKKYP